MALLPPFYPPHHFSGVPRPMKYFLMGAPEEYRILRFVMNNQADVNPNAIPEHVQRLVDNFYLTPVVVDRNPNISNTSYEYRLTPRDGYTFEAFLAQISNTVSRARQLENLGGYKVYVIEPQPPSSGSSNTSNTTNTTNPPGGGGGGAANPQTPGTPASDNTAIIVLAVLAITGIGALLILNRNK